MVAGGGDGTSPTVMRAFINRDDIDFGLAAELSPVQEFSLTSDPTASLEYATKLAKFQSVSSLTLYFNGGAPCSRIHFVGLRGEVRRSTCAPPGQRSNALAFAGKRPEARGSVEHRVRGQAAAARP